MTQEDKQLLLVDLCSRLPYGVICQMEDEMIINDSPFYDYILSERHIELFRKHKGFYIKPYLRPMSSMTEEEREELRVKNIIIGVSTSGTIETTIQGMDWLNAHYFDYRGLIPKGLAISTEEFNPYKD